MAFGSASRLLGRSGRFLLLVVALAGLTPSATARAHPHAWIDLRVEVLFDEAGRVTGLRQEWRFDEFYTLFVIDGLPLDASGAPDRKLLRELAAQNLHNLRQYDYFTEISAGGQPLSYGQVEDYDSFLQDNRLVMRFVLPLAEPVDPRAGAFGYAIYDPTYYIEMLHAKDGAIRLVGTVPERCGHRLEAPTPSFEAVSLAAALDRDQSGGDELGELFAERVEIRCD